MSNAEHGPSPESQELPPSSESYTIPRSALSEELWHDIIAAYYTATGRGYKPTEDDFLMLPVDEVHAGRGYRLGSRFGINSKLQISEGLRTDLATVSFDFYLNEDVSKQTALEAESARQAFRDIVNTSLLKTGEVIQA